MAIEHLLVRLVVAVGEVKPRHAHAAAKQRAHAVLRPALETIVHTVFVFLSVDAGFRIESVIFEERRETTLFSCPGSV